MKGNRSMCNFCTMCIRYVDNDIQDRQLEPAHLLYDVYTPSYVDNDIQDRQLDRECLLYVYKSNRVV